MKALLIRCMFFTLASVTAWAQKIETPSPDPNQIIHVKTAMSSSAEAEGLCQLVLRCILKWVGVLRHSNESIVSCLILFSMRKC